MTARLVHAHAELLETRSSGQRTAVVMTMGALHAGHAELVHEARTLVGPSGRVVVTVFVNPTQFGEGEDFERYPRTLHADVDVCSAAGADVVYAPSIAEIYGAGYPSSPQIMVDAGPLGSVLEGASRPGHFSGMLTVVAKFMHLTAPDLALFGEKDYQQLVLINQMVDQLRFPVTVLPVATVREADGLAMSSRNRYLSVHERTIAATIPRALVAATIDAELNGAASGVARGLEILAEQPEIDVDYFVITDPSLGPVISGPGRALVAVRIGATRLIDNMPCTVKAE